MIPADRYLPSDYRRMNHAITRPEPEQINAHCREVRAAYLGSQMYARTHGLPQLEREPGEDG